MKFQFTALDVARATDIGSLVRQLQRTLLELRAGLSNRLTIGDNMLAAVITLTVDDDGIASGTELQRKDPRLFRPIGFIPICVVNASGSGLGIASWAFNPQPSNGEGWHGVTVTVTSGTIARVTGVLLGG